LIHRHPFSHGSTTMQLTRPTLFKATVAIALIAAVALTLQAEAADETQASAAAAPAKTALTVSITQAQTSSLPLRISANGGIAAWQEASVGTEAHGLRLNDVKVNVGDVVKRGQVLATFAPDTVQAELAQIRASVAEAQATLAEAAGNAQRARELDASGALSARRKPVWMRKKRCCKHSSCGCGKPRWWRPMPASSLHAAPRWVRCCLRAKNCSV
jgi:multidrug efflux pump subunit AcrA (membrane-fusion protein)